MTTPPGLDRHHHLSLSDPGNGGPAGPVPRARGGPGGTPRPRRDRAGRPREIRVLTTARDTGALRAAVQTYLGWLRLAEATEAVASLPDDDGTP